jgi:hypothetical protein
VPLFNCFSQLRRRPCVPACSHPGPFPPSAPAPLASHAHYPPPTPSHTRISPLPRWNSQQRTPSPSRACLSHASPSHGTPFPLPVPLPTRLPFPLPAPVPFPCLRPLLSLHLHPSLFPFPCTRLPFRPCPCLRIINTYIFTP